MIKNNKGITLISLVVTIIVLLILAGVAIVTLTGDNGIITRTSKAKSSSDNVGVKEELELAVEALKIDKISGNIGGTVAEYVENHIADFKKALGNDNVNIENGVITYKEKEFDISEDGKISSKNTLNNDNNSGNIATSLSIGDSVFYSTSLNGVTLEDWKVFYVDGDYTYLIYGDYLPNAAVSITNVDTYDTYGVWPGADRETFIDAMTTTSNWSALINNGAINGTSLSSEVKSNVNVIAMGAPTVDLWVNSWNTKYTSDTLYTRYVDTEDIDNNNFFFTGYAIGDSANPTTTGISLSSQTGYSNTLYFPHQEWIEDDSGSCYGYWLASPHAASNDAYSVVIVNHDGLFGSYMYDGDYAFRPIIKLPTSVVATGVVNQ